jgi:toxin ParE1/3/4
MSRSVHVAPLAQEDINNIMLKSIKLFGSRIALRYVMLIDQAVADLASDAYRFGTQERFSIREGLYFYHLKHSKSNVADRTERISRPRHYLAYYLPNENELQIVRVLHERMKFENQKYSQQ